MAATTNGAGFARITRSAGSFDNDVDGSIRYAHSNFLDELPGAAFALITLAYIVTSLFALL